MQLDPATWNHQQNIEKVSLDLPQSRDSDLRIPTKERELPSSVPEEELQQLTINLSLSRYPGGGGVPDRLGRLVGAPNLVGAWGPSFASLSGVRSVWPKRSILIPYGFFPSNGCTIALGRITVGNSMAVGKVCSTLYVSDTKHYYFHYYYHYYYVLEMRRPDCTSQ